MALNFSATTDLVNCGDGTALQDITTGTIIGWTKLNATNPIGRIATKGLAGSGFRYLGYTTQSSAPVVQVSVNRATSNLVADGDMANFSVSFTSGSWVCVACVWDTGGANGDQKIYAGNLTTPLHEPSAYRTQTVGSGTVISNVGLNQTLGNRSSNGARLDGQLSWVGIWNRVLSLEELIAQQWNPHVTSGCVGFWVLGWNGTSTQPDWSGNGNNGSVTGATVAAHVPLRPLYGGFAGWRGNYTAPAPTTAPSRLLLLGLG